jgi:hypothetical protein
MIFAAAAVEPPFAVEASVTDWPIHGRIALAGSWS